MSVIFSQIGRKLGILILSAGFDRKMRVKTGLKSIKLESKWWFSRGKWEIFGSL
jgi:hypothetical protein